jgi:hypothetical protein
VIFLWYSTLFLISYLGCCVDYNIFRVFAVAVVVVVRFQ